MIDADTEQRLRDAADGLIRFREKWPHETMTERDEAVAWTYLDLPQTVLALLDTIAELRRDAVTYRELSERWAIRSGQVAAAAEELTRCHDAELECDNAGAYDAFEDTKAAWERLRALTKQQDTDHERL